jgi:hypothetical protein
MNKDQVKGMARNISGGEFAGVNGYSVPLRILPCVCRRTDVSVLPAYSVRSL